eukprot:3367773-Prymnesium_polylepis.2
MGARRLAGACAGRGVRVALGGSREPPDWCERVVRSSAVTAARTGGAAFRGRIRVFRPVRRKAEASTRDSTAHEGQFSAAGCPNVRDRRGEGVLAAAPTVCAHTKRASATVARAGPSAGPSGGPR